MKSLKSRYSLAQVNNNNYATINVVNKSESSLEAGYVWVPYIISQSPVTIESKQQSRKSKIQTIIDKL